MQPAQVQLRRAGVGHAIVSDPVMFASIRESPFVLQSSTKREMGRSAVWFQGENPLPAGDRSAGLVHFPVEVGEPFPDRRAVGL